LKGSQTGVVGDVEANVDGDGDSGFDAGDVGASAPLEAVGDSVPTDAGPFLPEQQAIAIAASADIRVIVLIPCRPYNTPPFQRDK
jgi:hypothetical protein